MDEIMHANSECQFSLVMYATSFHFKHLYMQLHPLSSQHKPNSLFLTTYTNETMAYDKFLVFLEHLQICENHRKCTPLKGLESLE